MGGGGKGGSKRKVYDYFMAVDYGFAHGPLDAINALEIKDKTAWLGPATADGSVYIDKKKLFGGDDGEGGPRGTIEFYLGSYVQKMSASLASRFGRTPNTAPGYRGLAHVFFRGAEASEGGEAPELNPLQRLFGPIFELVAELNPPDARRGFKWTTNNPFLPATVINGSRYSRGLTDVDWIWPIIGTDVGGNYVQATAGDAFTDGKLDKTKLPDSNPAAMIYECMTNSAWGKGEAESAMNTASYEAAAATLHEEKFGLSMKWMRQDTIENFISEVQDHIKAFHFQDPATGLWTLKLVRDDYTLSECLLLDESNCVVENVKMTLWEETLNTIRVSYTDPRSEKEETVEAQNLASIAVQGGVRSETRDYHGIRNPWLAKQIAERDVAEASRTLMSATVYTNRANAGIKPGDVIRLTWPDEDMVEVAMRVMTVNPGKSKDRRVKIEVTEDIFSERRVQAVIETQEPEFVDVDPLPSDLDQVFIMAPPMPALIQNGEDAAEFDAAYPVTQVTFLVNDADYDPIDVTLWADRTYANGTVAKDSISAFSPTDNILLGTALTPEVRSVVSASPFDELRSGDAEIGDTFIIGDSEGNHEIVMLDSYDEEDDEWTILRGVYDTVPETWTALDVLWNFPLADASDDREVLVGDVLEYKFLPRTRLGILDDAEATEYTYTATNRPHAPHRPADVEIDGNGFALTQYLAGTVPTDVTVTWATRNRLGEDAVAPAWDDVSAAPEAGQTTTIRFRDSINGQLDHEITGETGTSVTVSVDDFPTFRHYDVEVLAVRDGIESFRTVIRELEVERLGFGNNMGYDFGENDG